MNTGKYWQTALVESLRGYRRDSPAGIPVLGTRADLDRVVADTGAAVVVFAVGNAEAGLIREIRSHPRDPGTDGRAGARLLVVPETSDLDARNMQVTDLLGRHRVVVDHAAIGGLLTGRRVLVTCAGGEIGSELCRQIQRYDPAELMMLDHDEAALLAVQLRSTPGPSCTS